MNLAGIITGSVLLYTVVGLLTMSVHSFIMRGDPEYDLKDIHWAGGIWPLYWFIQTLGLAWRGWSGVVSLFIFKSTLDPETEEDIAEGDKSLEDSMRENIQSSTQGWCVVEDIDTGHVKIHAAGNYSACRDFLKESGLSSNCRLRTMSTARRMIKLAERIK